MSNDQRVGKKRAARRMLPPSSWCIICGKSIDEVGGKMLVAQQRRGVVWSETGEHSKNAGRPHQTLLLNGVQGAGYLTVWGDEGFWNADRVQRAKNEFLAGRHPWFCQICGLRTCTECGVPLAWPPGSDSLSADGCIRHHALLGVNPGCANPDCREYAGLKNCGGMVNPSSLKWIQGGRERWL